MTTSLIEVGPPNVKVTPKEFAERMVSCGVKVFALPAGQKDPYKGSHGCLDADLETGWWDAHPADGVGVACGETDTPGRWLLVIDLDNHGGKHDGIYNLDGLYNLAQYPYLMGMPPTLWVATPTGGYHLYYFTDRPVPGSTNSRLQVDLRGTGGYVVGAGSTHPNGGEYEVFWDAPIADANRDVVKFLFWLQNGGTFEHELPKPNLHPYTGKRRMPEFDPNGLGRNDALMRHAAKMYARGFSLDEVIDELTRANATFADPMAQHEVEKVACSMLNTHRRNHPEEGR